MVELNWTRRYSFQSVHQLETGAMRERAHGHQYFLEISFTGRDINAIDSVVNKEILSLLQSREISFIHPSTCENVVNWIHQRLSTTHVASRIRAVALQETRKNRFISEMSEARYV